MFNKLMQIVFGYIEQKAAENHTAILKEPLPKDFDIEKYYEVQQC